MDKDVKICIECKYFIRGSIDHVEYCSHKRSYISRDIVTGYVDYTSCYNMRKPLGICGQDAILYKKHWSKKLADFFNKIVRL